MRSPQYVLLVSLFVLVTYFYWWLKNGLMMGNPSSSDMLQCIGSIPKELPVAVLMEPMSSGKLQSLGGTGHWFHFFERILSHLEEARNNSWDANSKTLYVVFREKTSAENLGAIGRILLAAVVSGGVIDTIVIGYSTNVVEYNSVSSVKRFYAEKFHQSFVIDTTVMSDLSFLESATYRQAASTSSINNASPLKKSNCFRNVLTVNWNRAKRFDWFDGSLENFVAFRGAINKLCHFKADFEKEVRSVRAGAISNQEENNSQQPFPDDLDNATPALAKKILHSTLNNEPMKSTPVVTVPPNQSNRGDGKTKSTSKNSSYKKILVYQRDSTRVLLKLDEVVNLLRKRLQSSPVASFSDESVTQHRNLSKDGPYRGSRNLRNIPSHSQQVQAMSVRNDSKSKVDIIGGNISSSSSSNSNGLTQFGGRSVPSSSWTVEVMVHDNDRPPCHLIEAFLTATVVITPHGFQSILLLFQPYASLLVEIHPYLYVKPEVYGFVQGGLRQHVGLPRSYLSEESIPTVSKLKELLIYLRHRGTLTPDVCIHSAPCRYLSRFQNVVMSESLINRTVDFVLHHFH